MNSFLYKLERKFGGFAVPRLTVIILICSALGYILKYAVPGVIPYLTLNPYEIMHGQVWRLVSWVLITPSTRIYFVVLALVFYYSIGTTLEKVWGDFYYNLYFFGGMFFTVLGSFALMLFGYLTDYSVFIFTDMEMYSRFISYNFSMYYINLSFYMAYATTFPNAEVYLMFIFPVKIKWLAIVEVILLVYDIFQAFSINAAYGIVVLTVISSSMLNFLLFFFTTRRYIRKSKAQQRFRNETKKIKAKARNDEFMGVAKHKCAICGITDKDDENMTFRYCSKCEGNYEFCQEHLYTHTHFENNNEQK